MPASASVALDRVIEALRGAGISTSSRLGEKTADLAVDIGGTPLNIELEVLTTVTPASWRNRSDETSSDTEDLIGLIVADRVVGAARDLLRSEGQSWLDLRGHLYLTGPEVLVDIPVPASVGIREPAHNPFNGHVALEIACELLSAPERQRSIRELSRTLNRSPSSISTVMAGFRDAHLVTSQGKPVIPQLFWETAAVWKPAVIEVAQLLSVEDPAIASALSVNRDNPQESGWALTDSLAAAVYGAPTGIRADYPPDFYVPDMTAAYRARALLGESLSADTRAARIKVAPVFQICTRRNPAPESSATWPLAHPLFVALDLAGDPGRGTEILKTWYPDKGIDRVW